MTAKTQVAANKARMPVRVALQVLADARGDAHVVITNQGSARVSPLIDEHPLDFHYNPSSMGGAVPFALGLALACPQREVVVVSGDGALLMSLGSLVSVAGAGVTNLSVIVLDNGIYEVTGGQKMPGTDVDFAVVAKSVGFLTSRRFDTSDQWQGRAADVLAAPGPRFICLRVEPCLPGDLDTRPVPLTEQIDRLRSALHGTPINRPPQSSLADPAQSPQERTAPVPRRRPEA